ncbi:MAG TPA: sugar phosphate isomerase/epimerase family protein [Phycisphaerae bacterium]|nr:sugar phosphate isomerase/epimerase family protein [Phycisphaerae bacterium]
MVTFSAFADEIAPDLDVQMETCQAGGIRCIDVRAIDGKNVSAMTVKEAALYGRRLKDRGFKVPCIGSPIGKIRISDDFDAHLELLRHCCRVAAAFGTRLVRVFSFYPSPGAKIMDQRREVMDRMARMVELAEAEGAVLMHENERAIYGARPEGVKDLFATIRSDNFKSIFDPANFVTEGVAPYDGAWAKGLDSLTDYFHIKDKLPAADVCVPAGQGAGQLDRIFADLKARNWSGYMTLEPHMQVAGQFSGFTGPELFARAVRGLRLLCDRAGIEYG